ncbi:hypothetical protein D781_3860 [Serratia sp. FGI94]|uniref:hypothetical protein n=1 Tax=Serratia sp. FGI94 TaxID=671990 RepID=UPI0002A715F7|nr:hypothetical protein [Serratia sp. FGI94]AGB84053.1 hypothetical protein D781_3860 [Serratia sp. FGI94]
MGKNRYRIITLQLFVIALFIHAGTTKAFDGEMAGEQIAADMNKRFYDTSDTCGDHPAWFCNGIVIRAANASTRYHAWEASPDSVQRGGIAFSYFRSDLDINQLQSSRTQGFTLKSGQDAAASPYPLEILCSFPYDAGTEIRSHHGCGAASDYPEESRECASQGITTAEQWLTHFNIVTPASQQRYHHQCSFAADTHAFATSLKARRLTDVQDQLIAWRQNELSVATWPAGIGKQLPIESFFYVFGGRNEDMKGLSGAQFMQRDFLEQTGTTVPVIRISWDDKIGSVFSWHPEEQIARVHLPNIPEASGGNGKILKQSDYDNLDYLTVIVPVYGGMTKGDKVIINWDGVSNSYNTSYKEVNEIEPMSFIIPRREILSNIGHSVDVSFSVTKENLHIDQSKKLSLLIEGKGNLPPPVINDDLNIVTVKYNGITGKDVRIEFNGVHSHKTPSQREDYTGELSFKIPNTWIDENVSKEVTINYVSCENNELNCIFSQPLKFIAINRRWLSILTSDSVYKF